MTLHLGKIGVGKIAELIVHTFVKTVVQDLIMALFGAFPKKTAVGAEKEIKFWVFYSRLKSIFIDELKARPQESSWRFIDESLLYYSFFKG